PGLGGSAPGVARAGAADRPRLRMALAPAPGVGDADRQWNGVVGRRCNRGDAHALAGVARFTEHSPGRARRIELLALVGADGFVVGLDRLLQRLRWHTDFLCECREVGSADQRTPRADELRVRWDKLGASGRLPDRVVENRSDGQRIRKPGNQGGVSDADRSLVDEWTATAVDQNSAAGERIHRGVGPEPRVSK